MRKALVVGINNYNISSLLGCVNDACEIAKLLKRHSSGEKNFDVNLIKDIATKNDLRREIKNLFNGNNEIELFYFSGHGFVNELEGYVVTPDFTYNDLGIPMNEIINYAHKSNSKNKIIILDCCHSGAIGNMINNDQISEIGNGVTVLTASRNNESAIEIDGHGVFTQLLIN
ncbi:MAG: caspase family protein [Oscillospiraceae bacterium]|nr:caspase family protein [Oscillospiraceae bacterium]